jgi:predicted ester cyclase
MVPVVDPGLALSFLNGLHAAVNAHDAQRLGALCADEIVWRDPAAPATLHGRMEVVSFHRDVLFAAMPDVHLQLIEGPYLSIDGRSVAARLRFSGTMTGPLTPPGFAPTHGRLSFETAEFSQFDGGLLARHTVVLDMLDLARQIGAAPQVGSMADRLVVWLQNLAAFWSSGRLQATHPIDHSPLPPTS